MEASSWGSQAVAKYNAGYGTFDMKAYNREGVDSVLRNMEEDGFRVSTLYYVGDYLFIIFLGLTIELPVESQTRVFKQLMKAGVMNNRNAKVMAMELYAPFYLYHLHAESSETLES